jgi:hypothetical protein
MKTNENKSSSDAKNGAASRTVAGRLAKIMRVVFSLALSAALLAAGAVVRDKVDALKHEKKLTVASRDLGGDAVLESGLQALGGLRGLLADIFWLRAQARQESGNFHELTMLCDLILKLQPTFTGVHSFLAYNMCYMLANQAPTAADEWYWIRNGLITLEKGLMRNEKNYELWWEMGVIYYIRLSPAQLKARFPEILALLPRYEDVADHLPYIFSDGERAAQAAGRPAASDDHLRFAKYFFEQSLAQGNDPHPRRVRRERIHCLEGLGQWAEAEAAWAEMLRECLAEGPEARSEASTAASNLRFLLLLWMDRLERAMEVATQSNRLDSAARKKAELAATQERFKRHFPEEHRDFDFLLKEFRTYRAQRDPGAFTVIDRP